MRYLLDTSALLAHYRKEAGWQRVQEIFNGAQNWLAISSVSVAEFARRLRDLGMTSAEVVHVVDDYLFLCDAVVSVDRTVSLQAFEIGCLTPNRLPLADALIASCAQASDAVLVHRDRHMLEIPGLCLVQEGL